MSKQELTMQKKAFAFSWCLTCKRDYLWLRREFLNRISFQSWVGKATSRFATQRNKQIFWPNRSGFCTGANSNKAMGTRLLAHLNFRVMLDGESGAPRLKNAPWKRQFFGDTCALQTHLSRFAPHSFSFEKKIQEETFGKIFFPSLTSRKKWILLDMRPRKFREFFAEDCLKIHGSQKNLF